MEFLTEYQPVLATLAGIVALLALILRAKLNAFAALLLVAIGTAVAAGLAPDVAFSTVTKGMGGTLGFIAPIIGLGALFGAILETLGGVAALSKGVGKIGGAKTQTWLMGGLGMLAATPVFFDVGLLILMPFVAGLAAMNGRGALYFGLPLCAGLAVGHAFVPPTPGPIAIAELIGADLGWVILFGAVTGVCAMAVAGPLWVQLLSRWKSLPKGEAVLAHLNESDNPSGAKANLPLAIFLIAAPLVLILCGTLARSLLSDGVVKDAVALVGHPFSALLIGSGLAYVLLKPSTLAPGVLNKAIVKAFEPTGIVILVTGAGGAFKQVLVDTGAGAQLAQGILGFGVTPLLTGFLLAQLLRLAQGSATVAMITAGGLMAPVVAVADPSQPQLGLITIAIAAGATGFSHVNDSGFWLVSRLFSLSESETWRTWTMSTGLIAITGLSVSAVLYLFV